jgi:hypothetical protein
MSDVGDEDSAGVVGKQETGKRGEKAPVPVTVSQPNQHIAKEFRGFWNTFVSQYQATDIRTRGPTTDFEEIDVANCRERSDILVCVVSTALCRLLQTARRMNVSSASMVRMAAMSMATHCACPPSPFPFTPVQHWTTGFIEGEGCPQMCRVLLFQPIARALHLP